MIKGTCHCGAITTEGDPSHTQDFWKSLTPDDDGRMGANMANFEPGAVAALEVRRFNGADTWEYL